jgi:N-acetylglutamate synthase-like GNAT family acetyltransferase
MELGFLKNKESCFDEMSNILHTEWGSKKESATLEDTKKKLKNYLNDDHIPLAIVATENDELMGMCLLMESDPPSRKNLSPWFGGFYVKSEFRNQGIGSKLIKYALELCHTLEIKRLYLCTPDKQLLYKKFGFEEIDHTNFRNEIVTIMAINSHQSTNRKHTTSIVN